MRQNYTLKVHRWYNTRRWRNKSKLQLTLHPLCVSCAKEGLVVPATVADHIIPHRGDQTLFWFGELQSLCAGRHASVKAYEEGRSRRVAIGIDGFPLDPNHWWHRSV